MTSRKFDAVIFDLLTGLLDSWSLWDQVAGSAEAGFAWRKAYLGLTYAAGAYRPYGDIIGDAAQAVGLHEAKTADLLGQWAEARPWPEAEEVLATLGRQVPLAIVTNSSNALADIGIGLFDAKFDAVVTAEAAGFYKPRPEPYLMALKALGCRPDRALFVAGSPADIGGAAGVGMDVYWHNRRGLSGPASGPGPLMETDTLKPLIELVIKG